jgi:hypothetical protein
MSADTPACSVFISLCSHHAFPQAFPAFVRWKWFLRMYFVHFVLYTSTPSDTGFLLARMVNQRLVSEKNATPHREGTVEFGNRESFSGSLVKR